MSKSKPLSPILPEGLNLQQVEQFLLTHKGRETIHRRLGLLSQAAQGAALYRLQEEYGFSRELGNHRTDKTAQCGFNSWADLVKAKYGFSDDTAGRLMKVCDGMTPILNKPANKGGLTPKEHQRVREFLSRTTLDLSEAEMAVLEKITHKITDCDTQKEFLLECGYIKKPRGHGLDKNGGDKGGGGKNEPPDEGTLIQEDFYSVLDELIEFSNETIKRGKDDISKLALIPKDRWLTHRADLKSLIAKGDALHGIKEDK